MHTFVRSLVVAAALLPAATAAQAQMTFPIAVDVRGAVAFPFGEWNEESDLGIGGGIGFGVRGQVLDLVGLYVGWDRYSFLVDSDLEDVDATASSSGIHFGAQLGLPLQELAKYDPFVFGGLVINHATGTLETEGISLEVESDFALGWEIGAGFELPIGSSVTLIPGVRYRSHPAEFDLGDLESDLNVSYLSLDLGLRLGLF